MGVAVALLVVLGLVLGGYGIRQALRADGTPPGTGSTEQPSLSVSPVPSTAPATTESAPTTIESTTEPTTTEDAPENVTINPADYLFRSGSVAAANAADRGLDPLVVDPDGDEIDPEDLSGCRVTQIDPPFGSVPPGSRLQLTCREGL